MQGDRVHLLRRVVRLHGHEVRRLPRLLRQLRRDRMPDDSMVHRRRVQQVRPPDVRPELEQDGGQRYLTVIEKVT